MSRARSFFIGMSAIALFMGLALPSAPAAHASSVPSYQHVFVIVEENHGFKDVIGNPAAPNLNHLAKTFGLATDYFGVTHPSEPNYVALLGGRTFGISDDNPYYMNRVSAPSLITQMDQAGISWKAYLQGSPHPGFEGICYPSRCNGTPDTDPLYASKHDGIQNFTRSLTPKDWSRQVPIDQLGKDLASGSVPRFSYVIPDECHDMHGDPPYCVDGGNPFDPQDQHLVTIGDAHLGGLVSEITRSSIWSKGNNAIAIIFDEGDNNAGCCDASPGGGKVASIVVTSHGPRGISDPTPYNHYSLLRTIEDSFGLGCLGFACDQANVKPMSGLFANTGSPAIATNPLPEPSFPTPTPSPVEPVGQTYKTPSSGGWTVLKSPRYGTSDNSLGAIAQGSDTTWAVGNFVPDKPSANPDATLTLAMGDSGHGWQVRRTPNPGPNFDSLYGVASAGKEAWAVGVKLDPSYRDRTLIESWDGSDWDIQSNPQPGSERDLLWGASATSTSDVWAVGDKQGADGVFKALIEHFDGKNWSVVPSPNPGSTGDHLYGVAAVSPTNAWAVGQQLSASGPDRALIEHWNGTRWSVVPTATLGGGSILLDAVAANRKGVWAAGESDSPVTGAAPLVLRSSGGGWTKVGMPSIPSPWVNLFGAAVHGEGATVVGTFVDPVSGNNQVLIMEGSGRMKVQRAPDPGTGGNILGGIAATRTGLTAVGTFDNGGSQLNLIERRTSR
jgi:hypothetical protein